MGPMGKDLKPKPSRPWALIVRIGFLKGVYKGSIVGFYIRGLNI